MNPTTATARPMSADQAKPYAMALLLDLADAIGDKDAIQAAINGVLDEHHEDWPLIIASALGWTFAEHTRLDTARPTWQAHP